MFAEKGVSITVGVLFKLTCVLPSSTLSASALIVICAVVLLAIKFKFSPKFKWTNRILFKVGLFNQPYPPI